MARMYENGSQIGLSAIVNSSFARGVFDANSAAHHRQNVQWPIYVPPPSTTYQATVTRGVVTTWTPFGERSANSNVLVNARVTEFLYTPTAGGSQFLYLGYKMKNTTADGPSSVNTFYHDMTYHGVQVYDTTGGSRQSWFNNGMAGNWATTTDNTTPALTANPSTRGYTTIASGGLANRWNTDTSGTGSSHTGVLHGINTSALWPVATSGTSNFVAYSTGAAYCYVETSGAPNNGCYWLRRAISFIAGNTYSIRVAHYLNTSNTYSTDAQAFNDTCGIFIN